MAQEGVLGRISGRSWVSRACWEGPRPALGHPTPSAGVLPACRGGPRGALGVTGSWEDAQGRRSNVGPLLEHVG